jgi:IMP dehydrogenase
MATEYLTTSDVSLVPGEGQLSSGSDATLNPFIYSAPMDTVTGYDLTKALLSLGEYPIVSRFLPLEERIQCIQDFGEDPNVFLAVGFKEINTFLALCKDIKEKVNITLDIAHGDMSKAHATTNFLSVSPQINKIMSGSICTPDAAMRAILAGCTHLRVGVGPGAACTTRLMTGVGVPQLTAVFKIWERLIHNFNHYPIFKGKNIHIIADGGIKHPGDAVKYLAAGADGIMMGSAFSDVCESAGWKDPVGDLKQPWKRYRGQASASFQYDTYGKASACSEGASGPVILKDKDYIAAYVINEYRAGLQHGISYLGLHDQQELSPKNCQFIKVTPSGYHEGTPHGV